MKKATAEKREEVIHTCDADQPRGCRVSVAIEVYYFHGEGKLSAVTTELVERMGKKGRK